MYARRGTCMCKHVCACQRTTSGSLSQVLPILVLETDLTDLDLAR